MPTISPDKLAYIIEKARQFDALVPPDAEVPLDDQDSPSSSNPTDDDAREILLDTPDNPTLTELTDAIGGLNIDEQEELLALMWIGRGDFTPEEWNEALRQARDSRNGREPGYLVGTPLLADYLEEAAAAFEISLEEVEKNHL